MVEKSCKTNIKSLEKSCNMLQRKVFQTLEKWHQSGCKKAALLYGARQVGKTTSVRAFAAAHYAHFVEVNFIKSPLAKRAFDGELSTQQIVTNLSAMGFGPFVKGETLVFFDEIQECPNARTAIKFLVEDHNFDYIESGSLLGIQYKQVTSYPVGYEQQINVFPMDFEEFLWAKGIDRMVIDGLKQHLIDLTPIPDFVHQQISQYYREYLVVGGMPEVVQTFVSESDFTKTLQIQQNILTTYRADISHYASSHAPLVKQIFDAIPSALGKQDKRFILASLEKGASLRKYEDPTQWLIDAGLAYYSFNTKAFELPLEATENRRLYKLYLADTGLLCRVLLPGLQFSVMNGEIDINEGALTENFVACSLVAREKKLHYYDRKSKHELDFIIPEQNAITIIEVKSGKNYKQHASLNRAKDEFSHLIHRNLVLCPGNIEQQDGILYLPLYMADWI